MLVAFWGKCVDTSIWRLDITRSLFHATKSRPTSALVSGLVPSPVSVLYDSFYLFIYHLFIYHLFMLLIR